MNGFGGSTQLDSAHFQGRFMLGKEVLCSGLTQEIIPLIEEYFLM